MATIVIGLVLLVALVLIVGLSALARPAMGRRSNPDAGGGATNAAIFSDGGSSASCDGGASSAGCDGGGSS
ncbi:MAG: hypothetical protein ACT4OE_00245 [Sphingosinicella sp.]